MPADRVRDLAAELDPVFAALTDTERECADILDRARIEAARISAETGAGVESVRAAGRARVSAERAEAAAAIRQARSAQMSATSEAIDRSIAELQAHSERLLPSYVVAGVDSVRALIGGGAEVEPGRDPGGNPRGNPGGNPGGRSR